MTDSSGYSGNKVPTFQKGEMFLVWKMRFKAFAYLKGVQAALSTDDMPKNTLASYLNTLDKTKADEKLKLDWAEAKTKLLSYFTLSFNTAELMHKMSATMGADYPMFT